MAKKEKASAKGRDNPGRRSPCPVSCALDLFGDRWTLLVIRDLMLGRKRFKEFCESPENVPTNILTDRLERLFESGVIEKRPLTEGGKRYGYHLTEKGEALKPVLSEMLKWGLKWEPETRIGLRPSEGSLFWN
jgi:DNA-binding HxlR family transcriptional regulator